jgi:hypothetical protein
VRSRADTLTTTPAPWRGALRRHLTLLVAVKLAALVLLWALFFSPAHRTAVDSDATGRRLAVARSSAAPAPPLQESAHD